MSTPQSFAYGKIQLPLHRGAFGALHLKTVNIPPNTPYYMKQKLRYILDNIKKFLQFLLNPRFLLCFGLGWMITNGWSYILLGIGSFYGIGWMTAVAGAYLAMLWFPFSPEKIVTVAIAIALLKWLFPHDKKTLAVLHNMRLKAVEAFRNQKEKRRAKKEEKKKEREKEPE